MLERILVILGAAVACFFVGGGWHFLTPEDQFIYGLFYRADTQASELWAWQMLFLWCGPAASLAGAFIAVMFMKTRNLLA